MSKQRKMVLIAAAVGVIAMFLPWWSISMGIFGGGSVNGMHNEGIVAFLCFVAAGFLAATGDETKNLEQTAWMLTLIAGGIAALIAFITFLNAPPIGDRGIGLYLALVASLAVVAFAYINRTSGETLQTGFDTLKNRFTKTGESTRTPDEPTTKVINPANDPSKPVV